MRRWSPEWRDAFLYGISALFALCSLLFAGIPLYRQWAEMALGPYLGAAVLMAVVAWFVGRRAGARVDGADDTDRAGNLETSETPGAAALRRSRRHRRTARIAAFVIVLAGATVVPLTMEVIWRYEGNAALHVQPEVIVVERAGVRVDAGKNPYQVIDRNGHILIHQTAEPVYELYYPYLPGMVLFGFSSGSKVEARLTDARIQFLLFTVIVTVFALSRLRAPLEARFRTLEVLTVLPTAALPLATGGDDMPVVSLMLLGMVALQRRRPLLAGLALGAASSLKFTAWPLAVLALWGAWDLEGRRAVGRYVVGFLVVTVPVVVPFAVGNTSAFVDNVIRFPLGLAGAASPAASPLPGHLFVDAFPRLHVVYVLIVLAVGGIVLVRRLITRPPRDATDVCRLTGWVMLVGILLAPATRVGYLLYAVNLFVWAWMLRKAEDPAVRHGRSAVDDAGGAGRVQSASGIS